MVFTEEDAENDGMIKRDAGQQLNSVLSRKSGKLYKLFIDWCEENGRDPSKVLGDMILRAMRDEAYAESVSSTPVSVTKLEGNDIRREDLQLVTDMIEELGVDNSGGNSTMDAIDRMIEQRIEAMGSGPLGGMQGNNNKQNGGGGNSREMKQMEERLQRIEQAVMDNSQNSSNGATTSSPSEDSQSTDEIFSDISGDGESEESDSTEEEDSDDSVSSVDIAAEGTDIDEEDSDDDEPPENPFSTEEAED